MSIGEIKIKYLMAAIPFIYSFTENFVLKTAPIQSLNNTVKPKLYKADKIGKQKIVTRLQELAELPLSDKKKTLLFIPKSNRLYWSLMDCQKVPFVAPAITGMAMIDGLPEANCEDAIYYGYSNYNLKAMERKPLPANNKWLCSKALDKKISRIIVLDVDSNQNASVTQVSCW